MSQLTNINRGSGHRRDVVLRRMYGLDIPYGNCKGPTFSSGASSERMRASAERARRHTPAMVGTVTSHWRDQVIDISKMDKAEVLVALYNRARTQGMGILSYTPDPMKITEARNLLAQGTYFDYVGGRVMKVDLSKDEFDPRLYDRDNGEGAAEKALAGVER